MLNFLEVLVLRVKHLQLDRQKQRADFSSQCCPSSQLHVYQANEKNPVHTSAHPSDSGSWSQGLELRSSLSLCPNTGQVTVCGSHHHCSSILDTHAPRKGQPVVPSEQMHRKLTNIQPTPLRHGNSHEVKERPPKLPI